MRELSPVFYHCFCKPCIALLCFALSSVSLAAEKYTPSDVYAVMVYANQLADGLLLHQGLDMNTVGLPQSHEVNVKPMHVYELQVATLHALYDYALRAKLRPPPLSFSTPIAYSPTDVYYLARMMLIHLEEIYRHQIGPVPFAQTVHVGKTPGLVYQVLFELYARLNVLNGHKKIRPDRVYQQTDRIKADLQTMLLTLSHRLAGTQGKIKRMLVTAKYGLHPTAVALVTEATGKKPADVLRKALDVRGLINQLRQHFQLPQIKAPVMSDFGQIQPIDVFLQTQFIIAEINLLKMPLGIHHSTGTGSPVSGKTPSDVYQEMRHIEYMLERLVGMRSHLVGK